MEPNHLVLRRETPADYAAAEQLTREAFWNVYRPGCTEHYVLHVLRDDPAFVPELDLVLEADGRLIGHIVYMRAHLSADDGRELPVMTFGPVSIDPAFQGRGCGRRLLEASMARARELGAGALCIEGNPDLYGRFGFEPAAGRGIRFQGEAEEAPYCLVCELRPGYLDGVTGVYHTPAGYFVDEAEAEAFDRAFPPKRKERRPGQLV